MEPEPTVREQADEAMKKALAATGGARHAMLEEALRLHRLARAEELKNDPTNLLAPDRDGERD